MSEEAKSEGPIGGLGLDESPLKRLAIYLGLSSVAVAQPILDLLGSNPEVLSATKNTGTSAWAFVVGLLLLPSLVTFVVVFGASKLSNRFSNWLHYGAVGGFFGLFMLALARSTGLGNDALAYLSAIAGAFALTYLAHRFQAFQQMLRKLALLPVALLGLFAVSASGSALRAEDPEAVIAGRPLETPPIVFIVLDELPLWTLLDGNGEVDVERLPGFAALAEDSTLYRNTVAPSNSTQTSVPSIMTGLRPGADALPPFASIYPNSIFTLLGTDYQFNSYESTTSLCPDSLCAASPDGPVATNTSSALRALVRDAGFVYGHRILPDRSRGKLPRIDLSWGNFADTQPDSAAPDDGTSDLDADPWARHAEEAVGGPARQVQVLRDLITKAAIAQEPTLTFYHGTVPHRPWVLTPSGDAYRSTEETLPADSIGTDPDEGRDRYQRLLMQIAYMDLVIGDSVRELKEAGVWDEAIVILVADHGISLVPGASMRVVDLASEASISDIYRVPMFVKLPAQSQGAVNDCPALALDLIPTLVAELKAKPGWSFDGNDLAECSEDTPRQRFTNEIHGEPLVEIDFGAAELEEQIQRYGQWVDLSYGADAFARVGISAPLVGKSLSVESPDALVSGWTANELDLLGGVGRGSTPAQLTGSIFLESSVPDGTEGLVLVDGTVAGVIVELGGSPAGELIFSAILDPALIKSPEARIDLAIASPDGTYTMVGAPNPAG